MRSDETLDRWKKRSGRKCEVWWKARNTDNKLKLVERLKQKALFLVFFSSQFPRFSSSIFFRTSHLPHSSFSRHSLSYYFLPHSEFSTGSDRQFSPKLLILYHILHFPQFAFSTSVLLFPHSAFSSTVLIFYTLHLLSRNPHLPDLRIPIFRLPQSPFSIPHFSLFNTPHFLLKAWEYSRHSSRLAAKRPKRRRARTDDEFAGNSLFRTPHVLPHTVFSTQPTQHCIRPVALSKLRLFTRCIWSRTDWQDYDANLLTGSVVTSGSN